KPNASGLGGLGIEFPLFRNPAGVFKVLTGQPTDLVLWDIPKLVLPLEFAQEIPIPIPDTPFSVDVSFRVDFSAFLDLAAGFSTRGLQRGSFLDGFFFNSVRTVGGTEVHAPVLGVELEVGAGASLSVPFASLGLEAAIGGQID